MGLRSAADQAGKEATAFAAKMVADMAAARTALIFGLTGLAVLVALVMAAATRSH
ncbi:hypothetical protein ABT297_01150 [Dactylosporangium sp. NPDC000555]|uniref:hypothetical protein n=1 Tax=Dactylosporangium sp. NPDC000555 TaxID=3154260 RepID=UPI003324F135